MVSLGRILLVVRKKMPSKRNPWHGTEGFWLSPEGNFREVMEHFNEVKDDPGAFGISPERAAKWNRVKDREKALIAVMKKGFIRVRGHRDYTTFELWKLTDAAVNHMKRFVNKFAFYPEEAVTIHEISTHQAWNSDMRKLKYLSADTFHEVKTRA